MGEADDADTVPARALDAELHRLVADHLAVALDAVEAQGRAAVEPDLDVRLDAQAAFLQRVDVARHHADPVRIVTAQIGLDQIGRDHAGLAIGRAAGLHDGMDRGGQRAGVEQVGFGHGLGRSEWRRHYRIAMRPLGTCDEAPARALRTLATATPFALRRCPRRRSRDARNGRANHLHHRRTGGAARHPRRRGGRRRAGPVAARARRPQQP
jgi:hypothetical protein